MRVFRIHYRPRGRHIYLVVFVGKSFSETLACAGSLCMDYDEFADFQLTLELKANVKFIED